MRAGETQSFEHVQINPIILKAEMEKSKMHKFMSPLDKQKDGLNRRNTKNLEQQLENFEN